MAEDEGVEKMEPNGIVIDRIMAVAEDYPRKKRRGKKKAVGPFGDITDRKCQKVRGEIGEAMFLAKAARMGFGIATPWGDSMKYDMVIDTGKRLFRVQVKSAHKVSASKGGGYHVRACSHNRVTGLRTSICWLGMCCRWMRGICFLRGRCEDEVDAAVSDSGEEEIEIRTVSGVLECFEEEAAPVVKARKAFTTGGTGGHRVNLCLESLGTQAEQGSAQARVTLGLADVGHFTGRAFRADDFDELIFFGGGPVWEVGD